MRKNGAPFHSVHLQKDVDSELPYISGIHVFCSVLLLSLFLWQSLTFLAPLLKRIDRLLQFDR